MSKIDDLFRDLRAQRRKALMPFLTAGDPDLDFTCQAITQLAHVGAAMCEIGIPYSDPIADGPVIQASYQRALDRGIRLRDILDRISAVAPKVSMPLVSMVSSAIIFRRGLETDVREAKQAGFSGAIVPDLLIEEAAKLKAICDREDFSLIQLVTPTTPRERQKQIAD